MTATAEGVTVVVVVATDEAIVVIVLAGVTELDVVAYVDGNNAEVKGYSSSSKLIYRSLLSQGFPLNLPLCGGAIFVAGVATGATTAGVATGVLCSREETVTEDVLELGRLDVATAEDTMVA